MSLSDEHYTPKWLFDQIGIQFQMDVAAPVSQFRNCPANEYLTFVEDGLKSQWQGIVWMNPPFSKATPWVNKFIEHRNGIALLVVSRSKWFANLWDIADAIVPTPYNLKFERPNEKPKSISFQTFLFALGSEAVEGLERVATARIRY